MQKYINYPGHHGILFPDITFSCILGEKSALPPLPMKSTIDPVILADVLNSVPNPILIHENGKVLFANEPVLEMTGFSAKEIAGKTVTELLTDPADPETSEPVMRLARGTFAEEEEFEIRAGSRRVVIRHFLMRNRRLRFYGDDAVLTILVDITERRHLENFMISRILETEEKDRKRFAADLHDDLGPILSSIRLHLGLLENAKDPARFAETLAICNSQLGAAITKIRAVANNLMPRILENFGLEAAIGAFIGTMRQEGTFEVTFISGLKEMRFPKEDELHLYRIVCELINNTVKHAGATAALLSMKCENGSLEMTYSDNGKGYDAGEAGKKPVGMGLANIIRRAGLIGARIEFTRRAGKTEVHLQKFIPEVHPKEP